MINLIRIQVRLLCKRKELYFVFYCLLAISIYSFITKAAYIWNSPETGGMLDYQFSFPAYANFILHPSYHSHGLLYTFVSLLACPLIFSDSYFIERKGGIQYLLFVKVSKKKYLLSKAIVIFIFSVLITATPLLLNFLWNSLSFPLFSPRDFTSNISSSDVMSFVANQIFFNKLYFSHPYLYNLYFIFLLSIFAASFSLAVFGISFCFYKFRAIVNILLFLLTNIIMLLLNMLRMMGVIPNKDVTIVKYFMPADDSVKYSVYTSYLIIAALIITFFILLHKELRRKDEL